MLRLSTVVFASFFIIHPASSQDGIAVNSPLDCGRWIQARTANQAQARGYEWFLVGLLNGIAIGSVIDFWRAKGNLGNEQVYLWMDNYCRSKPLSGVLDGTIALVNEHTGDAFERRTKQILQFQKK